MRKETDIVYTGTVYAVYTAAAITMKRKMKEENLLKLLYQVPGSNSGT